MEAGTEKRYQEFISASKEIDEVYHMLALKFGLSDSAMWILCTMREANREPASYTHLTLPTKLEV